MLRLKPSELTLTPEDVDEALNRMARRQQSRASAATAQRRTRYSAQLPLARLIPGAQRFVGNDITNLSSIPILSSHPQPQQAIIEHIDDDSENSNDMSDGSNSGSVPSPTSATLQPDPPNTPANLRGGANHDTDPPVRYLQGYFEEPNSRYKFVELVPCAPYTDPSQKKTQRQVRQRSYSSNDVPPARLFTPSISTPRISAAEADFWTATAPTPATERSADRTWNIHPRQHSSEASNTSLAYSVYQLPESRQPSGGTYHSVRLSDAHALADNVARPRTSTLEAFNVEISATTINRPSPLETLAVYARREAQRLGNHQAQAQRGIQFGSVPQPISTSGQGPNPYQHAHGPPSYAHGPPTGAFNQPMAMADDPYTRGVSAHISQSYGSSLNPRNAQPAQSSSSIASSHPRNTQAGRSNQRSSENAPVGYTSQVGQTGRTSQVREQVSAFEQMHDAAQPRQSRRRAETIQVPSTRRNNESPSSPMPAVSPSFPPPQDVRQYTALSPSQGNAGRRSIRFDPRLHNQENSGEAETAMIRSEFESVSARYNEAQQGDVMDETPPRIGRIERYM